MKIYITDISVRKLDVSTPDNPFTYIMGTTEVDFDVVFGAEHPIRLSGTVLWGRVIDERAIVEHIKNKIYDSITEDTEFSKSR